ncbi:MAG: thioredoxin family protein [Bacteroidetes bacterium]|nr:thioredoxin family protein [Bacteroidota bacterium]
MLSACCIMKLWNVRYDMKTIRLTGLLFFLVFALYGSGLAMQQDTGRLTFTAIQPVKKMVANVNAPAAAKQRSSLPVIFAGGFLGGLAALLMPCIFPMLPLTVGFFTKRQEKKKKGWRDAALYGLAIILIYVGLGMLVTVLFGASALNRLATSGVFNFCFFLLLVLFAASFLGAFELTLPHRWVNRAEAHTGKSGFGGIFMMAAVLALVSFSCTGPIIGTLLVQAASSGQRIGPALGMFGFALALALPFVLFALFPSWLQKLPKSGNWMNSLKISLGFIELALSLKFLSNVDLAYHWHWFDREVFLVLWILITGCFALYLLGKLKLMHDSNGAIGVGRLFAGIVVGAFSLYLVPGLWGAPLKSVAAFLPPQQTQDFDLYSALQLKTTIPGLDKPVVKYADLFRAPLGLNAFFDYREGVNYARKVRKPVLIDFTGHACVNCRKMEADIWPDPAVLPLIRDQYVLVQLYVDDKTAVSGDTTIGDYNSGLEAAKFNSNSQPDYVLLDPVTEQQLVAAQGADYNASEFAAFLKNGLERYALEIQK